MHHLCMHVCIIFARTTIVEIPSLRSYKIYSHQFQLPSLMNPPDRSRASSPPRISGEGAERAVRNEVGVTSCATDRPLRSSPNPLDIYRGSEGLFVSLSSFSSSSSFTIRFPHSLHLSSSPSSSSSSSSS